MERINMSSRKSTREYVGIKQTGTVEDSNTSGILFLPDNQYYTDSEVLNNRRFSIKFSTQNKFNNRKSSNNG